MLIDTEVELITIILNQQLKDGLNNIIKGILYWCKKI